MTTVVFLKSRLNQQGGLEKYTRRLAEAFVARGCTVKILTTGACPSWGGIEVIELAPSSKWSLHHLRRFDTLCHAWIEREKPAVVFGMERTTYQTHYRAGNGVHRAFLAQRALTDSWLKRLSFHFNPLHRYILKVEQQAFEHPALKVLFTNSEMVRREILEHYATPADRVRVVHNGVEWSEKQAPFDASLQMSREGPFHFLFVGNGFKRKGLNFILEALPHLSAPYQLTVVGRDKNMAAYQRRARHLNVRFVGQQADVTPFYQEADALLIPSIYDPFSNVTLEALAMGLYVVSSRYNGGHEVLTPQSGMVIKNLSDPLPELEEAMHHPKTSESATAIRQSIKELDFTHQLDKIVAQTL